MKLIIAIDFDGTIVEHEYPKIGKPKLFAFQTLKELKKQGHTLIMWTYRSGKYLDEAVEFCKNNGVEFYAVNKSYPEEVFDNSISRKINADVFIDDRNIGGFLGWSKIWEILKEFSDEGMKEKMNEENLTKGRKSFFNIFKK